MSSAVIRKIHKSRDYRSNKDRKYYLDVCGKRLGEHSHVRTDDWLVIRDALLETKVMTAIMENKKPVVLKIGEQDKIYNEFNTSRMLYESRIPGFIKYICAFTCKDDLFKLENRGFCNGEGDSRHALIMPYFKHGSVKTYKWTLDNFHMLKSIINETITCCVVLGQRCNIIHNDLHADNVMMVSTNKTERQFDDYKIYRYGFKPVIIDLELFRTLRPDENIVKVFCGDLRKLFSSMTDLKVATIEIVGLFDVLKHIDHHRDSFNDSNWDSIKSIMNMVNDLRCRKKL